MTREQKMAKIDALREKKRRILSKKPTYTPNKGQLPVHMDVRPIRVVQSGNGAGKSTLAVQEVLWWSRGVNPVLKTTTRVPAVTIVVLDKPAKVEEIWLKEFAKWTNIAEEFTQHKNGKPYVDELRFKNGSTVRFYFHDQTELTGEGVELTNIVFDEPPPRRLFVGLTRGMRGIGVDPKILMIGTPIREPWVYEMLYKPAEKGERPDIGIYRFGTDVNEKNLRPGYMESYGKNLTAQEKAIRFKGMPGHLEGLALNHLFNPEIHVVKEFPWPRGKPVVLVIDPAQAKPHVAILVGVTGDGRIYYLKELSFKGTAAKFALALKEMYAGYRVVDYVIDSLGETPGTGGDGDISFSDKLRQLGVPVRATSYEDKSDENFITGIKQVLEIPEEVDNFGRKLPKLAVVEGNSGIINDIELVAWLKYKNLETHKPKLDISNRDYLACLKYALATSISYLAVSGKMPKVKHSRPSPWSGRR